MSHVPPGGSGQFNPLTNPGGTILATARPLGSAPPINLADPNRDHDTFCKMGAGDYSIASLIKMGVLTRIGATLTENYATRQGGGTVTQSAVVTGTRAVRTPGDNFDTVVPVTGVTGGTSPRAYPA